MPLNEYHEKRQFDTTPEPLGSNSNEMEGRFVVQEHFASHHHFDFRLALPADYFDSDSPEEPNVLKSWAVPKGISNDKGVKRLGIMVEDHPLDYISFEGTIPEGNYGAGTVTVWDKGSFEVISKKTGSLKILLQGKKLTGEFHLVHTKRGKGNEWLIFK
jgi:bifunctional non-homologous end joining protein LigD